MAGGRRGGCGLTSERHDEALLEHALDAVELRNVVPAYIGVALDHVALQPAREFAKLRVGRHRGRQARLAQPVLPRPGRLLVVVARGAAAALRRPAARSGLQSLRVDQN